MHIGFDAKRAFNNTSGLGNYSRFVVSSLVQLYPHHRYSLFSPKIDPKFNQFYSAGANTDLVLPSGMAKLASGLWRLAGLNSEFSKRKLDLCHGLSNELPYGISGTGTKLVVTIHDLILVRFPELYHLPDRLIYKRKFTDACQRADHIVAISEQTKADVVQFLGTPESKITVVYQDCDPVFHQALSDTDLLQIKATYRLPERYILCVGTIEKRKNQLNLLKAWHQSSVKGNTHLVFVGRQTNYAKELHQYIAAHQLGPYVHFLPYIPFQHLPGIYQLAKLFVYPSVFEGFGIPILEALNSGTPVISSTGSCFSEAGGPGSVYVDPHSVADLELAITNVLCESDKYRQMVAQGYEYALRFRAQETIPQLMQVYERVLGS